MNNEVLEKCKDALETCGLKASWQQASGYLYRKYGKDHHVTDVMFYQMRSVMQNDTRHETIKGKLLEYPQWSIHRMIDKPSEIGITGRCAERIEVSEFVEAIGAKPCNSPVIRRDAEDFKLKELTIVADFVKAHGGIERVNQLLMALQKLTV